MAVKDEPLLFLRKFFRHGTKVASITPSSRWLSKTVVRNVVWDKTRVIIELGAGTGPVTHEILKHKSKDCIFLVVERDDDFLDILRKRFSHCENTHIIKSDCSDLDKVFAEHNIDSVDYIISGLPFSILSPSMRKYLMKIVAMFLSPQGFYNQITEFPLVHLSLYRRLFNDVKFVFEPRNIPPAGVYICRLPKEFTS